jgi:hypothetical protein
MGKLWIASAIAILSSIPPVFGGGFGSPMFDRIIETTAVLSFPGMYLAQILALIGANYTWLVKSLGLVFLVSVITNTIFYWALFSLVAGAATMLNRKAR